MNFNSEIWDPVLAEAHKPKNILYRIFHPEHESVNELAKSKRFEDSSDDDGSHSPSSSNHSSSRSGVFKKKGIFSLASDSEDSDFDSGRKKNYFSEFLHKSKSFLSLNLKLHPF